MTDRSVLTATGETYRLRVATDHRPEIIRNAARLFAQKRFDEVLMEEVAARAGIAKGTVYRFFPTKEDLYAAICVQWLDRLIGELRALAEDSSPVTTRMEAMIAHSVEHFRTHKDFYRVLQRQEPLAQPGPRPEMLARRSSIRELYARLIREGQASGELRGGEAASLANMLLGMIRSQTLFSEQSQVPQAIAREVLDLFLHGTAKNGNGKGARKSCR